MATDFHLVGSFLESLNPHNQCDQTGRFSKVLGTKITYKVTQTLGDFLAFLKDNLKVKTAGTTLMGNIFSKIGLLFNLTSGHTETNGNNH